MPMLLFYRLVNFAIPQFSEILDDLIEVPICRAGTGVPSPVPI